MTKNEADETEIDSEPYLAALRSVVLPFRQHAADDIHRIDLRSDAARSQSCPLARDTSAIDRDATPDGAGWQTQVVEDVYHASVLYFLTAAHHGYSVGRLLYAPVSLRAVQVLARSVLESAARAWWVLDPAITTRERLTRGVVEILQTTTHDATADAKAGRVSRLTTTADSARAWASGLGFSTKRGRGGVELVVGHERPSTSRLVGDLLRAEGLPTGDEVYSYLSAATHASPFHNVILDGKTIHLPIGTLKELLLYVELVTRVLRATHLRVAGYSGSVSRLRVRPYDSALEECRRLRTKGGVKIGVL